MFLFWHQFNKQEMAKKSRREIEFPFKYFPNKDLVRKEEFQNLQDLIETYLTQLKKQKGHSALENLGNVNTILDSYSYFGDSLFITRSQDHLKPDEVDPVLEKSLHYLSKERRNIGQIMSFLSPESENLGSIAVFITKSAVEIFLLLVKLQSLALESSRILMSKSVESFLGKIQKEISSTLANLSEYDLMMLEGEDACVFLDVYFRNKG